MFLQFNLGEKFRCFGGSDKKIFTCVSEYHKAGNFCEVQNFAFFVDWQMYVKTKTNQF